MITRKLGKLFRGRATPFQIVTACALGAMLGFAPAFALAPGLYALLVFAVLVANANLGLALFVAAIAKPLSWTVVPSSFAIGRMLLDGPASGAAATIVHAPILAWCGLDHYAIVGGQALGLASGLVAGFFVARGVTRFRHQMAAAEEGDSRLLAWGEKRWARVATWVFFGKKKGGASYAERAEKQTRLPLRPAGLAAVGVLCGGAFAAHQLLGEELATNALAARLETLNGATVDVGSAQLDVLGASFTVEGLALANPDDLDRDLFRVANIVANVRTSELLARRVHVERISIQGASMGATREVPGLALERIDEPVAHGGEVTTEPGAEETSPRTLDDVLVEAKTWKSRLARASDWLERIGGEDEPCRTPCGREETDDERVRREMRANGLLHVASKTVAPPAPTFRLSELAIGGLTIGAMPGRTFALNAREISSAPWLVDGAPTVSLESQDGAIRFAADLAPASRGGGLGGLSLHWKGIDVDEAMAMLRLDAESPLRGGTLDLSIEGPWANGIIGALDLPLHVTFHGSTLVLPGVEEAKIESLAVPVRITGSLRAPLVHFETGEFTDALLETARREAESRLRAEVEARVGEELGGALDRSTDAAKRKADGLLNGFRGLRRPR